MFSLSGSLLNIPGIGTVININELDNNNCRFILIQSHSSGPGGTLRWILSLRGESGSTSLNQSWAQTLKGADPWGALRMMDYTGCSARKGYLFGLQVWERDPFFRMEVCERGTFSAGKVCERGTFSAGKVCERGTFSVKGMWKGANYRNLVCERVRIF